MKASKKLSFAITKVFILMFSFLIMPTGYLYAKIDRIDGPKCSGTATMTQGEGSNYIIEGHGVDLSTGISVSGSGVSGTIKTRWNGAQNQQRVGRMVGAIEIRLQASTNAATGTRTVYINYPLGRDNFSLRIIGKGIISGASVPTFSAPFQSNVDIKLTGTGLSKVTPTSYGVYFRIIKDAYHPLLDSGGQEISGVSVTGLVNTATNTNYNVDVRLNFSHRLTRVTLMIYLRSSDNCSGLNPSGANYTVTLTAPVGGPNYVKDHLFDRTSRSYRIGEVVGITIRLDRAVPMPPIARVDPRSRTRQTQQTSLPAEVVYWAVVPSNAVQQAGASGTPYNPVARYNQISIPAGQQSKAITFQISRCTAGGTSNTMKFVTWKPNPNNDLAPNRKETSFTVSCR